MDRWSIVTTLNYLDHDVEAEIVLAKAPELRQRRGQAHASPPWSASPT